jgi:hypothetical protein
MTNQSPETETDLFAINRQRRKRNAAVLPVLIDWPARTGSTQGWVILGTSQTYL